MKGISITKALSLRIFTSLLLLFFLVTFLFFLLRAAPGNPAQKYIAAELSPELNKAIREEFSLDEPLLKQYYSFLMNLSRGEFGVSFVYRRPVLNVISEFIPFTILFSLIAMLIQLSAGYYAAKFVFRRNKGSLDRKASALSLILYSAPTFLIGVILILIFSEVFNFLPSSGVKSYNHDNFSFLEGIWDYLSHLILPVMTLSAGGAALFYNYFRESLGEVSGKLFVLNLKANGFREKVILNRHIIPNALGPLISVVSVEFGVLLGGALITEMIFSLPGMGRLTVNAILTRDYPLVIGCSFFAGCMIIFSNLAADFIKARIDRRLLTEGILN